MALVIQSVERARDRTSKYVIGRPGRPPGALNNINSDVRDMILTALNRVGGAKYLARQAEENPSAFMSLVGRIMPKEVVQEGSTPIHLHLVAAQLVEAQQLAAREPAEPQRQPLTIDGSLPKE